MYVALATALVWFVDLFLLLGTRVIELMEGAQDEVGRRQPQITVYGLLLLAALFVIDAVRRSAHLTRHRDTRLVSTARLPSATSYAGTARATAVMLLIHSLARRGVRSRSAATTRPDATASCNAA